MQRKFFDWFWQNIAGEQICVHLHVPPTAAPTNLRVDTVNVQLISAGRLKGIYADNLRTFVVLAPDEVPLLLFFSRRFKKPSGILYVEVCLPVEKVSGWSFFIIYHCLNPLQRTVLLPG